MPFFTIRHEMNQLDFYHLIEAMYNIDFKISITTEIDDLSIDDVDDQILQEYEELESLRYEENIYSIIGYLAMKEIDIKNVIFFKNPIRIIFYKDFISFDGTIDQLKSILKQANNNPEYWIKGEIKC